MNTEQRMKNKIINLKEYNKQLKKSLIDMFKYANESAKYFEHFGYTIKPSALKRFEKAQNALNFGKNKKGRVTGTGNGPDC